MGHLLVIPFLPGHTLRVVWWFKSGFWVKGGARRQFKPGRRAGAALWGFFLEGKIFWGLLGAGICTGAYLDWASFLLKKRAYFLAFWREQGWWREDFLSMLIV